HKQACSHQGCGQLGDTGDKRDVFF
ncbi:hypothetical protein D018_0172B, partial [Vibrio parahaemolyticus VP2007-007]